MGKIINLPIDKIHIWIENPRIEESETENEAILKIYNKLDNKMVNLAKDISENGLLNANNILVVKDQKKDGYYTVIEGNRRISAIKTLLNPEILNGTQYYKKINTLDKSIVNLIKDHIPCSLDTLENQLKELELIHNGENNGLGRINWGSYEKTKYFYMHNKILDSIEPGPLILHYIENSMFEINDKNKNIISNIKVTNISRLLKYKNIKKYFNINKYSKITQNQFDELIDFLVFFYNSGNKVDLIYKVADAVDLINNYKKSCNNTNEECINNTSDYKLKNKKEENTNEQKNDNNAENSESTIYDNNTTFDNSIDSNSDNNNSTTNNSRINNNQKNKKNPKPSKFFDNFKWCALNSKIQFENGIIIFCQELKSLSESEHYKLYPTSTSILMRAILESSLIYYAQKNKDTSNILKHIQKNGNNNKIIGYKNLGDIITEYLKQANNTKDNLSIFYGKNTLTRCFKSFAESQGTKAYLDLIIHQPGKVTANPTILENIAESGFRYFIETLLN